MISDRSVESRRTCRRLKLKIGDRIGCSHTGRVGKLDSWSGKPLSDGTERTWGHHALCVDGRGNVFRIKTENIIAPSEADKLTADRCNVSAHQFYRDLPTYGATDEDLGWEPPNGAPPSTHVIPGPAKVEVLRNRVEQGYELWSDEDPACFAESEIRKRITERRGEITLFDLTSAVRSEIRELRGRGEL